MGFRRSTLAIPRLLDGMRRRQKLDGALVLLQEEENHLKKRLEAVKAEEAAVLANLDRVRKALAALGEGDGGAAPVAKSAADRTSGEGRGGKTGLTDAEVLELVHGALEDGVQK